jgi:hypothetical protein
MAFSLPFMWLFCFVSSLPYKREAILISQGIDMCLISNWVGFQKKDYYYGLCKLFNILYDYSFLGIWGIFLNRKNYYYYVNVDCICRNCILAKCGGEAQHSQSWGLGVLRDSRMFRVQQYRPKHLSLRCSWCCWKGLEM